MKVASVVGARPQFVKAVCLSRALHARHREVLIHTGQHYDPDMSDIFFSQLELPEPDYHLGAGSGTHARQTARMLEGIEDVLLREHPDIVVVYGDTNSTVAAALAAAKLHIPVAHVEAGLRSFNRRMPEEINRVVTDHLSDLLFCPTKQAANQLRREGIRRHVYHVGDIMYDAVLAFRDAALRRSDALGRLGLKPGGYVAATVHRAENTDSKERLEAIFGALAKLDVPVVLPLHPRTAGYLKRWGLEPLVRAAPFVLTAPLPYLDMLCLVHHAKAVLTDSGGLQKEAYMLQTPCLTLRGETEWTETVEAGWNRLVSPDMAAILESYRSLSVPGDSPPVFGDGNTAELICKHLERYRRQRSG